MNTLRTLAGATVAILLALLLWAAPASSNTPPQTEGDVNCDKVTNSIDAALILQVDAGLIDTVSCAGVADLNLDGTINSLDAAIILQITAGLCCDEPLTAKLGIDSLPIGVLYRQPLPMALLIKNASDRQVERTYSSGQRFDFIVSDVTGTEVWRWSHGMAFTAAIAEVTFEPGETVTYIEIWNQQTNSGEQVEPGTYELHAYDVGCGMLPAFQCDLGATLTFEILAPPQ
ncbi:MAG: hypothetical protein IIC90_07990 [Chloroflexi bacterium]|nr:hypothetical protein [Chloroflexota bacterium]